MPTNFSSTKPELWDSVAGEYQQKSYEKADGNYPANSFRSLLLKEYFSKAKRGKVLDAGCGTGAATRLLLSNGWDVTSADYSPKMLEVAEKLTAEAGLRGRFHQCRLQELGSLNQKFDYIMLNGVLPYVSVEEEPGVYEQIRQVCADEAVLISSHYNLYFDLFGFDKWTVDAYKLGILRDTGLNESAISQAAEMIEGLLTDTENCLDREKTMKTEDPLEFNKKLKGFGFNEFDQAYYNFFYLPTRFEKEQDQDLRSQMELRLRRNNKGLLLARTFVSFAKRLA